MYDIAIIGGGPGGYELAISSKENGLKVLLIEQENLGGVCLNSGCIPTKTIYQAASLYSEKEDVYGITNNKTIDFSKTISYKDRIVLDLRKGILESLKGVDVVFGKGSIVDHNTVMANDNLFETKYIVIATGSKAIKVPGFEDDMYSKDILNLNTIPNRLAIIGGGVIGIEMASIYSKLGSQVTVIEMSDRIIPYFDSDISKRLLSYLKNDGITFHLNSVALKKDNKLFVRNSNGEEEVIYDKILVCVGRRANITLDNLDSLGVNYNKSGIIVDKNFRTTVRNIFAIGDVTGKNMLAHYATFSGYQVLNTILAKEYSINFDVIPSCVFTFPEVSMVGYTEKYLQENNIEYKTYKHLYRANGKAQAMNKTDGYIKLIVKDDLIIGCSIIGYNSSVLIHEVAIFIEQKTHISKIKNIIHAHPTLSEIISEAVKHI